MDIASLQQRYGRIQGLAESAHAEYVAAVKKVETTTHCRVAMESAQAFIQSVAQATQKELEYHISELGSLAMQAVFDDPYELKLAFESKRGRTEAKFTLERDGESVEPLFGSGGGVVDILALALRLSLWSLRDPRPRPVIVLDEPFKWPSSGYRPKVAQLLSKLSSELGIQMIIVTHDSELASCADRVFSVAFRKGRSVVSELS